MAVNLTANASAPRLTTCQTHATSRRETSQPIFEVNGTGEKVNGTGTMGTAKFVFHRAKLINYHKMIGVGYSTLMITECKKLNMLPVCDYYSWCGLDKRSLYIGQRFHLADPAN
eukprot:COSAG05_NODE_2809_length_2616_cov_2.565356_1_plen_114_part_00